jgi:hypothetical protein
MTLRVNATIVELTSNGTRIRELFCNPESLSTEQEKDVINSEEQLKKYISFCNKSDYKSQYIINWIKNKDAQGFKITWEILD